MRSFAARHPAAVLLALAIAAPVRAQFFWAPPTSTLFDTSIRASAMGGAGAAVMWGEPGVWGNPATLAGVSGIGWLAGHTKVSPSVSDQLVFSSQRLLVGGGGVGFSFMGQPISGLGKAQLDYGTVSLTPFGDISSLDRTEGWGVGVSPLRLVESFGKLTGSKPGSLTKYGDLWLGYQGKESEARVNDMKLPEAGTYDWGAAGRLALAHWWGTDPSFRLDLSGAYAQVNVLKSNENSAATTVQYDRMGVALHLSPTPPNERSASPPSLPWWRPGDVPELSMGLAYDHERRRDEPFESTAPSSTDHYGFEAYVFRLLSLRVGYLSDPDADIQGVTYGGGLTLPIGLWGNVGYELASVPLGADVDRQFRQGWSVWVDPARIWSGGQ